MVRILDFIKNSVKNMNKYGQNQREKLFSSRLIVSLTVKRVYSQYYSLPKSIC